MLAVRMNLLVELPGLGIADHKAFLVVSDGGADHLARDRQKFLVERSHQRDRPLHEACNLVQQHLVLDQFKALRERQLLGVGEDDVLARLRVEHDFRGLQLGFVILEAAHRDRSRRHEAVAEGGLAGLDAVDGKFYDVGLFGLRPEGRDDRMQRPHPGERA